jgi:hypothetical protein
MKLVFQRPSFTLWMRSASGRLAVQAVMAASLLGSGFTASAGTDGSKSVAPVRLANAALLQPQTRVGGSDLGDLTASNWQWFMSIPFDVSPTNDTGGLNCGINQDGPVWFLGGPLGGSFTRTCHIPSGKKILSPIIDFVNDFPCPDPTFKPAPGQSLEAFLTTGVTPLVDAVTLAEAQFDGKPLAAQRVTSKLFRFTGAVDLSPTFDPCVTGSPQLGVSDGYFVLIQPPSRGKHVLHIRSVHTDPKIGTSEGTYNLIID